MPSESAKSYVELVFNVSPGIDIFLIFNYITIYKRTNHLTIS